MQVADYLRQGVVEDETAMEQRVQVLRKQLATVPSEPDSNVVITGHSSNPQLATGAWLREEGAAVIFRPAANGKFTYIATVTPTYWQELVQSERGFFA